MLPTILFIIKHLTQHRGQIVLGLLIALMVLVNTALQPIFSVQTVDIEVSDDQKDTDGTENEQSVKELDFVSQSPQNHNFDGNPFATHTSIPKLSKIISDKCLSPFCESTKRHLKKLFSRIISRNAP